MEWDTPVDRLIAETRHRDERRARWGRWRSAITPAEEETAEQKPEIPRIPNPVR